MISASESMFLDFDGWLKQQPGDVQDDHAVHFKSFVDPARLAAEKDRLASIEFVHEQTRRPRTEIADNWHLYRGGVAERLAEMPSGATDYKWEAVKDDDAGFAGVAREAATFQRDRRNLISNVHRQAFEAALSIDPELPAKRKAEVFAGLNADGVPGMNPDDLPALYRIYNDAVEQAKFNTQGERSAAREAAALVRKGEEVENFALDYLTPAVERLMKLPKDRRDLAIEFLRQDFSKGGKSDGEQVGLRMRGKRPMGVDSTVEGAALSLGRGAADVTHKLVSYGERMVEALGARDDSEFRTVESKLRELVNGTLSPLTADGLFQQGVMGAAQSLPAMAMIAAGPVGTALSVSYYQQGSYEKFKADPRLAGASEAKIGMMSLASGVAQSVLDKVELGILSKLPGAATILGNLRGVANPMGYVGREAGKAALGIAAETGVEVLQDQYTDAIAQQVGAWLSSSVASPEWAAVNAEALRSLPELAMTMIPLVTIAHGVGGVRDIHAARALASTPELLRVAGFGPSQALAIAGAENPVGALRAMWGERNPMAGAPKGSTPSQVAAQAVEDYKAARDVAVSAADDARATPGVAYVQRTNAGWQVIDTDGQAHAVKSEAAVPGLLVEIGKATTIREAEAMQQIADSIGAKEPAAKQVLTGDKVTVQRDGGKVSVDSALKLIPFTPATLANFNAQLSLLGADSAIVNGANWIAEDGPTLLANKSGEGILTQVHEFAESRFRSLIDNDVYFGNHAISAARVVAPLFDVTRGTAEDKAFAERVQRVASGKTNETEARETLVELVVADVLGRRKDGGLFTPGAITAGVSELINSSANPAERASLGKFRAFLRAVRAYLHGIFSTAARLSKGRRDGVIKPGDDFTTFAEKLLGVDAVKEHNRAVIAEATGSLSPDTAGGMDQDIPAVQENPNTTLYRASTDGGAYAGAYFSESEDDAKAYQDNPGFGGPNLFGYRVNTDNTADAETLRDLAKLVEPLLSEDQQEWAQGEGGLYRAWRDAGFDHVFQALENEIGPRGDRVNPQELLKDSGSDWIRFLDDFPEGAVTYKFIGEGTLVPNENFPAPSSGASASLGSVTTLEALANQVENANAAKTPKERMLAYTALAEDLRGMARAIRFNDDGENAMEELLIRQDAAIQALKDDYENSAQEADSKESLHDEAVKAAVAQGAANLEEVKIRHEFEMGAATDEGWTPDQRDALRQRQRIEIQKLKADQKAELDSLNSDQRRAKLADQRALGQFKERMAELRQRHLREQDAVKAKTDREAMRRALITLDAMLAKMPSEARGRIGGFTALAQLTTDAARQKFLEGRLEKMDAVFEKYLQKQYRERIRDLLHKAKPKGGSGEKAIGKIGAFGHAWMDYARGAAEMTEAKAAAEITGIEAVLARDLTPDEIAELGRFWGPDTVTDEVSAQLMLAEQVTILEAFGGFDEMTAAELARAYKAADDAYENGRFDWLRVVLARKEFRAFRRDLAVSDAGGPYDAAKHNRERPGEPVVGLLDMHLSFEQIVGRNFGAETETHKWTREAARKAQDAETDIIDTRRKEFADFMAANLGGPVASRVKLMALQERVDTGFTGPHAHLSQNQAIHLTMLYRDEASRDWMETHKWTADVMAEIEGWLTDDAKAVRSWLIGQYGAQYDRINRVHVKLKGVALPRVENYAPRLVEHGGKQQDMAIGQDNAAGMVTGFLRRRFDRPQGPPKLADALVAYWGNQTVVSHWLAWAETMGDFRGTIGSRDARLAAETHKGRAISSKLSRELNAIEEGGVREAIAASEVGGLLRRWFDARSKTALFGKLSVIVKQLPALFGSAAKVRGGKWLSSASRVMSGRAAVGLKEMFESPVIQRRVSNESEIAALAAKGNKNTPGLAFTPKAAAVVDFAMGKAGGAIGLADAAFTTFSAAVAYDATFREMKEAGMSDDEATRIAWDRTAVVVGQTAQPQTLIDKSLLEVEWPTMGRLIFAFQGANRQAWSLMYEAIRNAKKDPVQTAQVLGLFAVLIPTLTYLLGGVVRYAQSDDDLEDEFSMKGWGVQLAAAPLQGMIVVGPVWEGMVGSTPRQADSPVASDLSAATSAIRKLVESDEDRAKRPKDQRDFDGKDLGKILDGLATAVGGRAAAIGVANNVLQQVLGTAAAVTPGDQGRESFQAKRNRADAKKEAKGKN